LREIYRVLRPGGRFIFSVPSHLFGEMLLGSALCRAIHLSSAAQLYESHFNNISLHYHNDAPQVWLERLNEHGFRNIFYSYYLSAKAHRAFDFAHYMSIHCLLSKRVTGRWTAFTPGFVNSLYARWLHSYYEAPNGEPGPYLFFITERSGIV
jgi:SAM-dependent methyltransferase